MSMLPLEALLRFTKAAGLHLCQHVICHNPARLPSPAMWVNVKRIRLKDSFTHVWWLSKSENPKADNRQVLTPYGEDMKRLLRSQKYNSGRRPSGHKISETGFLTDHGGSIGANVLEFENEAALPEALLKFTGTKWDAAYRGCCERFGILAHLAWMQVLLAGFFVRFFSDPEDLVFDPLRVPTPLVRLPSYWVGAGSVSRLRVSMFRGREADFQNFKMKRLRQSMRWKHNRGAGRLVSAGKYRRLVLPQ
ncbi:MAG: hypothetical protein U5N27_04335 [Rhizobium sp.]|nr:hypothetical protein [Rhizobium sp.]